MRAPTSPTVRAAMRMLLARRRAGRGRHCLRITAVASAWMGAVFLGLRTAMAAIANLWPAEGEFAPAQILVLLNNASADDDDARPFPAHR